MDATHSARALTRIHQDCQLSWIYRKRRLLFMFRLCPSVSKHSWHPASAHSLSLSRLLHTPTSFSLYFQAAEEEEEEGSINAISVKRERKWALITDTAGGEGLAANGNGVSRNTSVVWRTPKTKRAEYRVYIWAQVNYPLLLMMKESKWGILPVIVC